MTYRFLFATYGYYDLPVIDTVDLKVVGYYVSAANSDTIFSSIGYDWIPSERSWTGSVRVSDDTYDSFLFTVREAGQLPAVRGALEDAGFTYVRSAQRMGVNAVIDDGTYLNTTHSMERQIKYSGMLSGGDSSVSRLRAPTASAVCATACSQTRARHGSPAVFPRYDRAARDSGVKKHSIKSR